VLCSEALSQYSVPSFDQFMMGLWKRAPNGHKGVGGNVIKLRNKIIKIIVLCILQIPLNPPFSKGEALFLSSSAKKMVIPPFEKGGLGGDLST